MSAIQSGFEVNLESAGTELQRPARQTRAPNAVDFWRGFALATIFINHVPGNTFEQFTYRNVSISDSAELFVFLAGWSLRLLVESTSRRIGRAKVLFRVVSRGTDIYFAQLVISFLALTLLASAALILNDNFILDWHNAAVFFATPGPALIGLALITHQLGYFDILPLYVVLMLAAPVIALLEWMSSRLLLGVSFALYVLALVLKINFATWPMEGRWFLNPLAWQFIFVLGYVIAADDGLGALVRRRIVWLRWPALAVVVVGAVVGWYRYSPDPLDVPWPQLLFTFDKTFLSPARLIHFLGLAVTFADAFSAIKRWLPAAVSYFVQLGRQGLIVFCSGSLLSLCGQIIRYAAGGTVLLDAVVIAGGLGLLWLVAVLAEMRRELRR